MKAIGRLQKLKDETKAQLLSKSQEEKETVRTIGSLRTTIQQLQLQMENKRKEIDEMRNRQRVMAEENRKCSKQDRLTSNE